MLASRRVWIALLSAVIVLAAVWSIHVVEKKAFAGSEAAKGSFSIWRRTANVPQEGSTPRRERLSLERGLRAYLDPLMLSVPLHPQFDAEVFRPPLSDEILAAGDYANATDVDRAIDENLRWLMRAAILVAIVTLPIAFRYSTWRVMVALLPFGAYLNFPPVLGNSPLFRHAIYAVPANLLCAYIGLVALVWALGERYLKKPAIAGI